MMTPEENKRYWKACADAHGTGVHATTPSSTAKQLEIDALWRHLKDLPAETEVLEAGCGNGANLIELAKRLPSFKFDGFDYVAEMAFAGIKNAQESGLFPRVNIWFGDVLEMDRLTILEDTYEVVFTDRCLINLQTWEDQKQAIKALADKVRPGGTLMMIENVIEGRQVQNRLRKILGLEERPLMPPMNLFFDQTELVNYLWQIGLPVDVLENISSLHDLCLYVLAPALNQDQEWQYCHPLVDIATKLSLAGESCGNYGQNVLFVCRKPA